MTEALKFGLAVYGIVFVAPAAIWLIWKGLAAVVIGHYKKGDRV